MKRSAFEFRIPSASLCKRPTMPIILSAPYIHGDEVPVIEAGRCARSSAPLGRKIRMDGSHQSFPQRRLALFRLFACQTEGCRRDCLQPGLGNAGSASLA